MKPFTKLSNNIKILIFVLLLGAVSVLSVYFHNPEPQQKPSLKTPEINKPQPSFHGSEKPGVLSNKHSPKPKFSKKAQLQTKPDKTFVRPDKQPDIPPLSVSKKDLPETAAKVEPDIPPVSVLKKDLPKTAAKAEPEIPADELLKSPEVKNRLRALSKLEEVADKGDKEAKGLLYESLNDDDGEVRARAAEALGWIEDKQAVKALTKLLKNDEDPEVRASAADALGEIGDKTAIDALKYAALNDKDEDVQDDAMDALTTLRK